MDSGNRIETPQTPPGIGRHTYSSDGSTVCGEDLEKRDLESQCVKEKDRSLSHYLGLSSPVSANLDDIDEEDIAESDDEDEVDVNACDHQKIDDHPNGYPRLAAFLNSDENFLICRKYGLLHNRVLLYRQDELRELEQKLIRMDAVTSQKDENTLQCRTREARVSEERGRLIQEIDDKLKEYHDIVQRTRDFASMQRATERNYNSVCNFLYNAVPLVTEEASTFHKKDRDFVAIVDAKEGSWFDGRVENALSRWGGSFTRKLFISKRDRSSTSDKLVRLYSKRRIDIFSRLVITFLAVVLLMAPVIALFGTRKKGYIKILIIFLFTMAFSVALSLCTRAKRHEVFAATAA